MKSVVFRVDGSPKMGLGHIYRCIALAEYLAGRFEIVFVIGKVSSGVIGILPPQYKLVALPHFETSGAEARHVAEQSIGCIVVLDGYQFNSEYQKVLKDAGIPLVFIDDKHEMDFHADVIINHAGGLTPKDFKAPAHTKFFLGLDYSILRLPFLEWAGETIMDLDILICFGGADPWNKTLEVLKQVPKHLKVAVVVGGAYSARSELEVYAKDKPKIKIHFNLMAGELASLMRRSKFAVTSASTVAYEYLASARGQLYLIKTADNQETIYRFFLNSGIAKPFEGKFESSTAAKTMIDRKSPERFVEIFTQLGGQS